MLRFQASSLFSDHAVLARDKEIRIFGEGEEGCAVTAELTDASGRLLARDTAPVRDGRFLCLFRPLPAQNDCALALSCGQERVVFRDIAIGDVYLAGGQSNMELELQNADEGPGCIRDHLEPLVRYYNVPKRARAGEETDRANRDARWVPIAPGTGKDMSAVAYFFAMKMRRETGVAVGIIDCYWGGTSITCWMDEKTLEELPEGRKYLAEYAEKGRDISMEQYLAAEEKFLGDMDRWNAAVAALKKENPAITWPEINQRAGLCPWNPPPGPGSPYRPAGLYETMLRRVIPCALTGVLFYQGEEDTARTDRYDQLLSAFVLLLRRQFREEGLPFLNVQLPMWIADGAADSFTWPRLRLCQQRVKDQLRRTGLVTLLDQGEYDNIHPTAKRVVGERLVEEAKRLLPLGLPFEEAPQAVGKYTEGNALHVLFSQPLIDRGTGDFLLEIAGEDGAFFPARVQLLLKEAVLTAPEAPRPTSVRYAWTDYASVRLFGENGWPLMPFCFR